MAASFRRFTANPRPSFPSTSSLPRRPSAHAAAGVAATEKEAYWEAINADIRAHLQLSLPLRTPLVVHEAVHCVVFSSPQSPAPALCVAACELVGGRRASALAAAAALHLLHAACSAHERLPDRRPSALPANIALMTGDAVHPLGYQLVAESVAAGNDAADLVRVLKEMATAMGAQGVADGQLRHVSWFHAPPGTPTDRGTVLRICRKKHGELFACAAVSGAILGGAGDDQIEKLRKIGLYLGMVYGLQALVGGHENGLFREAAGEFKSLAVAELRGMDSAGVSDLVEMCCRCI